jgi:hypothetical protein
MINALGGCCICTLADGQANIRGVWHACRCQACPLCTLPSTSLRLSGYQRPRWAGRHADNGPFRTAPLSHGCEHALCSLLLAWFVDVCRFWSCVQFVGWENSTGCCNKALNVSHVTVSGVFPVTGPRQGHFRMPACIIDTIYPRDAVLLQ